jgi:hypothetical protein
MLLVLGLLYAGVFWAISWRKPKFALMMIFACTPFQNDISGGGAVKFSLAEINLLLALPILLLQHRRFSLGPLAIPIALYLGISLLSSFAMWRGSSALVSIVQMVLFMVIVVMVFASLTENIEDYRLAMLSLLGVAVFLALVVLVTRSNFVLGLHKNGIGASLGCALLIALELWFAARRPLERVALGATLLVTAAALVFTLSRGAWIGALLGVMLIMVMRRQFALMGRAALLLVPVLALCWSLLPAEQRDYATSVDAKRWNIKMRVQNDNFAQNQFEQSPLYGVGVGLRKQYDATNLWRLTLAETGVAGLAALALVFAAFFRMVWTTQAQLARDHPAFSAVAIGGALMLARLAHGMVDHYWSRGGTMMAWASAGMALNVYFLVRAGGLAQAGSPLGFLNNQWKRLRLLVLVTLIEHHRRSAKEVR